MPARPRETPEQVEWLRTNYSPRPGVTQKEHFAFLAAHIGVCPDTVRRILVRHNIASFASEKYLVALPKLAPSKWRRPCIICGDTKSRPKWHYRCKRCTERLGIEYDE